MKQKIFIRMLGALLLVISFGHGHASRRCTENKTKSIAECKPAAPGVHFGPLDIFKW